MKSPIVVAGLENTGKTTFINAILQQAKKKGQSGSALKPFELGLLKRNANEAFSDGELFCKNMQGEPMETLVSPSGGNPGRGGFFTSWNHSQQTRLSI